MIRKFLSLLVALSLLALPAAFAEKAAPVRVGALKGPTAMGMVKMMKDQSDAYAFTLAAAPDELVPLLVKGDLDIALIIFPEQFPSLRCMFRKVPGPSGCPGWSAEIADQVLSFLHFLLFKAKDRPDLLQAHRQAVVSRKDHGASPR